MFNKKLDEFSTSQEILNAISLRAVPSNLNMVICITSKCIADNAVISYKLYEAIKNAVIAFEDSVIDDLRKLPCHEYIRNANRRLPYAKLDKAFNVQVERYYKNRGILSYHMKRNYQPREYSVYYLKNSGNAKDYANGEILEHSDIKALMIPMCNKSVEIPNIPSVITIQHDVNNFDGLVISTQKPLSKIENSMAELRRVASHQQNCALPLPRPRIQEDLSEEKQKIDVRKHEKKDDELSEEKRSFDAGKHEKKDDELSEELSEEKRSFDAGKDITLPKLTPTVATDVNLDIDVDLYLSSNAMTNYRVVQPLPSVIGVSLYVNVYTSLLKIDADLAKIYLDKLLTSWLGCEFIKHPKIIAAVSPKQAAYAMALLAHEESISMGRFTLNSRSLWEHDAAYALCTRALNERWHPERVFFHYPVSQWFFNSTTGYLGPNMRGLYSPAEFKARFELAVGVLSKLDIRKYKAVISGSLIPCCAFRSPLEYNMPFVKYMEMYYKSFNSVDNVRKAQLYEEYPPNITRATDTGPMKFAYSKDAVIEESLPNFNTSDVDISIHTTNGDEFRELAWSLYEDLCKLSRAPIFIRARKTAVCQRYQLYGPGLIRNVDLFRIDTNPVSFVGRFHLSAVHGYYDDKLHLLQSAIDTAMTGTMIGYKWLSNTPYTPTSKLLAYVARGFALHLNHGEAEIVKSYYGSKAPPFGKHVSLSHTWYDNKQIAELPSISYMDMESIYDDVGIKSY